MNTNKSFNGTRVAVLLGALCFSTLVFAAPIEVKLEVDGSKLAVIDNSQPCDATNSKDACINVKKNKAPFINFILEGACGDETSTSPNKDYQLTGIRITLIEKVWPTSSNVLNELVAKDFKADPETGEIILKGNNKKDKDLLKFKNRNSHGYTVYYEVSAEPCAADSDLDDIFLDPEIRNKGRG